MEKFMSKFLRSSLLSSIVLAFLGILLFFKSELAIDIISYVVGGVLVAIGVIALLKYIVNSKSGVKNELDIVYGVCITILGIVVITNPNGLASIIPFVIGIVMIISSAAKISYGFDLKRHNNQLWKSTALVSLITLIVGLLLVFNPFAAADYAVKVVGILIFVSAVLDIVTTVRIKKTVNAVFNNKQIEVKVVEAEVIEDNTKDVKEIKKIKEDGDK